MHILTNTQGLLLYIAMAAYAAAAILLLLRRPVGWVAYGLGFAAAAGAFALRWQDSGHIPLKNLYDVMMFTGTVFPPLSVFCRFGLLVRAEALDAIIGIAFLFPVGFMFNPATNPRIPALQSPLFVPHVLVYMLGYAIMAKATVQAVGRLCCRGPAKRTAAFDRGAYRLVAMSFPLLTAGLLLGAWWGKLVWTSYWHWDPKELWSLATWLSLLIYLHCRRSRWAPARLSAGLVIVSMTLIAITLLWANLSTLFSGLHSYGG